MVRTVAGTVLLHEHGFDPERVAEALAALAGLEREVIDPLAPLKVPQ